MYSVLMRVMVKFIFRTLGFCFDFDGFFFLTNKCFHITVNTEYIELVSCQSWVCGNRNIQVGQYLYRVGRAANGQWNGQRRFGNEPIIDWHHNQEPSCIFIHGFALVIFEPDDLLNTVQNGFTQGGLGRSINSANFAIDCRFCQIKCDFV